MKKKIAIIGRGNMGQAIAQGVLSKKIVNSQQLILTDSKTRNNKEAVTKADIVILAVKPQIIKDVLVEIKEVVGNQLIISIAAGVTIASIEALLGTKQHIVRVMPNLAAGVGESMSGWIANNNVATGEKKIVREILSAIGKEIELSNEKQLDMVTAISGSGPAYFFYFVELLQETAKSFGLSEEVGHLLAQQTLVGAGEVLRHSRVSAKALRLAVTSKGGTTEAAFTKFEKGKLEKLFQEGVVAAYHRAKTLRIS